jgi:hypothetical protein
LLSRSNAEEIAFKLTGVNQLRSGPGKLDSAVSGFPAPIGHDVARREKEQGDDQETKAEVVREAVKLAFEIPIVGFRVRSF